MTISDVIRENTHSIRDSLASLGGEVSSAKAERDSAEERRKRASTEISTQNTIERETKQALSQLEDDVDAINAELDELNRRRQEIVDLLFKKQEEQAQKEEELKRARRATEKAHLDIKREEKSRQDAEDKIFRTQTEIDKRQSSLTLTILDCLGIYLGHQSDELQKLFLSEEQRSKEKREIEAFNLARHSDPVIAELYDQRVELKKFLASTMVPGVKQVLQASLLEVEEKISSKYPSAFKSDTSIAQDKRIEELLYYMDDDGTAVLLLPITADDWDGVPAKASTSAAASRILCFWWNLINELKLKSHDVSINSFGKYLTLKTGLSAEEIAILQEFGLKCENSMIAHYLFTTVPAELQEAICREN